MCVYMRVCMIDYSGDGRLRWLRALRGQASSHCAGRRSIVALLSTCSVRTGIFLLERISPAGEALLLGSACMYCLHAWWYSTMLASRQTQEIL